MKAILIDPFEHSIKEVEYSGDFRQIYELIGAECFDVVRISHEDSIFVDDMGLMNNPTHFFIHEGYLSPLAGKGLVLGCDENGDSISPVTTVEEVKSKVKFANIFQLRARYAA